MYRVFFFFYHCAKEVCFIIVSTITCMLPTNFYDSFCEGEGSSIVFFSNSTDTS